MINFNLQNIKALVFDVDGVLSTNQVLLIGDQPVRNANIKDGYALQHAAKTNLHLAIITGGKSEQIKTRYERLGIHDVFMGVSTKIEVFEKWLEVQQISANEVLYMGDDIPDYQIMNCCGCPCCPADAAQEIKDISLYISPYKGGEGCVRDVVEQVLRAQDLWMSDADAFGW